MNTKQRKIKQFFEKIFKIKRIIILLTAIILLSTVLNNHLLTY